MATLANKSLTLDEFDRFYGDSKPYHEYWFGEAIPKALPIWLHGLLQVILTQMLYEIGFVTGAEVRLKLSGDAQPLPDVIATAKPCGTPYPTEPFDVAIEILSPADSMQYQLRKCRLYSKWGIAHIFVFDPEDKTAQEWNHERGFLEPVTSHRFEGKPEIPVEKIWAELDKRAQLLNL